MLSVTFDRASLELPDLVITSDPFAGDFWLPEDGLGEVVEDLRRTYAPDSSYAGGRMLLAAVPEASEVPLAIYAQGDTTAEVAAAKAVLKAAAGQWDYDLTVTVDGVSTTYRAEPSMPRWGAFDSGMVRAHIARSSLVIPVNP